MFKKSKIIKKKFKLKNPKKSNKIRKISIKIKIIMIKKLETVNSCQRWFRDVKHEFLIFDMNARGFSSCV